MPTSRPGHRADLEALRGIAILLVIAYHAGVPALAGGFVGVDVFFVLSGYFTARLLAREYGTTGAIDLPAFWLRRAGRLLPSLLVVVAATLAAVWTLWAPIDRAGVAETARAVLTGTSNDAFAREAVNYFGGGARSPFLHSWSLAVELQVALVGPPLFLLLATLGAWRPTTQGDERARRLSALLRGVGPGLAVVGAISLGTAIAWTTTSPSWAFFGTAARAWEFAAGALLALMLPAGSTGAGDARTAHAGRSRGWWLQAGGIAAVIGAALLYDRATPYPGTAALLPVLGAAAVIAGGIHARGPLGARRKPVRALGWLGELSYGWYLWHWPIMITGVVLVPSSGTWARLALCVAALGPAWLTHRWIERRLYAPRDEPAQGARRWIPAAMVAACLALALGTGVMRRAAEHRVQRGDQRAFAAARADRMPHECWTTAARTAVTTCVFGDPRGSVTVALFGDSHAEHWLAAFDRLGRERGWRVVLLVKGGCPVADTPELVRAGPERRGRECARHREEAIRRLIALRPAVAVLSSYDEYVARDGGGVSDDDDDDDDRRVSPGAWGAGLQRTYARLAGAGVPVVAIRGTPRPGFDVPACLSRRAAGLPMATACGYARDDALHRAARAAQRAAVRDLAARGLPVAAIDLTDEVCPATRCGVARDGRVVFTDDNHLTASFTRAMAGVVGARLDAALAPMGVRLP